MEICESSKCTGCYACVNICPKHCITMNENDLGELHPVLDEKKCISCNACKNICPNNTPPVFQYPQQCYAAWITDREARCICASGGIATYLSRYIIEYKKGIVFGTAYDDKLVPRITYTDSIEGLEAFKGSKYVQSIVGDTTFQIMKGFVFTGRTVLFIGTPCQIAAAKNVIGDRDNFYTIDLICHGVSPTRYFIDEIQYLIQSHQLKDIIDVRFRGNDGNNFKLSLWDKFKKSSNNYALTLWEKVRGGVK